MNRIHLIRYLVVLRVNGSFARRPTNLSTEISLVLGSLIAQRLPTNQAHVWQACVAEWEDVVLPLSVKSERQNAKVISQTPWPIESVLFAYPGKMSYGPGEPILWELKLFGEHADHGYFLEVILPALEEAGYTSDSRWTRSNRIWGNFDIDAIYTARGSRWEPFVTKGKLDLQYHSTPRQWMENWTCDLAAQQMFHIPTRLTWLTSFDLARPSRDGTESTPSSAKERPMPKEQVPRLQDLLEALLFRVNHLTGGTDDIIDLLEPEERSILLRGIESTIQTTTMHDLGTAPRDSAGRWRGSQIFHTIPASIVPYLELASILHIGRHTHLGCGTFVLNRVV